jgi:hypothetical protein
MPCSYKIYKDKRLVVTTASEVFTYAEGLAHEDQIYREPDFDANFAHLIDGTSVTKAELTPSELQYLARGTRFSLQSRRAMVVASPVLYGIARMFEAYLQLSGSGEFMSVFKEREKALEWLGVDGDV